MLQPPTPRCHSSLALLLPRHSRDTRLCVWCSSEATRLKTQGGKIRPDSLEQIQSKASKQGSVASVWLMPWLHINISCLFRVTGNTRAFILCSRLYIQNNTWRCLLFLCDVFWNLCRSRCEKWGKLSSCGFPFRTCHVEAALLGRTDTVELWSVHLSDLFCFTGHSTLIAQWSMLPFFFFFTNKVVR